MTILQQVTTLVMQGLWPSEIKRELPSYSDRTVRQYCTVVMTGLEPEARKAVEALRMERGRPKGGVREFFKRKTPGEKHVILGGKIYDHRRQLKMTHSDYSEKFKLGNRLLVSVMEQGYHDFTLTELEIMSDVLSIPLATLLEPKIEDDDDLPAR